MKNLIMTIAAIALTAFTVQAQVNTDVNEKTTVKKVTEKGTTVKTKVTKNTKTAKDVLKVEGDDKQDQKAMRITDLDENNEVIENAEMIDPENSARMMANEKRKEMQLQESIDMQMEAAKKEKQMLMDKKMQMEQEMMERRNMLMKRPEGMSKLNKDIDGDGIK